MWDFSLKSVIVIKIYENVFNNSSSKIPQILIRYYTHIAECHNYKKFYIIFYLQRNPFVLPLWLLLLII